MKLNLTKEHARKATEAIAEGNSICSNCIVAQALKERYPLASFVEVTYQTATIHFPTLRPAIKLWLEDDAQVVTNLDCLEWIKFEPREVTLSEPES